MPAFLASDTLRFDSNASEVEVQLGRLQVGLSDYTAFLEEAKLVAIRDTISHFAKERDPEGDHWAWWADSYKDYAEEHNQGGILYQEGHLYKAATDSSAYQIDPATGSLFIDTSGFPIYWRAHQYGEHEGLRKPGKETRGGRFQGGISKSKFYSGEPGGIPQRAFLGLSAQAKEIIVVLAEKWLDKVIDEAIFYPPKPFRPRPMGTIKGSPVALMPGTEAGLILGGKYYHEGRSTLGRFAKL